jgi:hypothetical protein
VELLYGLAFATDWPSEYLYHQMAILFLFHLPYQMVKLFIGSLDYLTLLVPGTKMAIKSREERKLHFQERGAVMGLHTHFIYKGANQICYLIKNSKT